MNLDILRRIFADGDQPSGQQLALFDTIISTPSAMEALSKLAASRDADPVIRNWAWNLLFLGSLPRWFYDRHTTWTEALPETLKAQAESLADALYCPALADPRFFGSFATIPTDCVERVWELLVWRLELGHSH